MMQHATMTVPSPAQKNNNHIQPTLPPCGPPTAISSSCSQSMTESSMALHSPSTTGHPHGVNAISVSYGSISIPSNFHQSQTSTPTGGVAPVIPAQSANADCVETLSDPISNLRIAPTMPVTCTKSNPVTPSHSYSFSVSKKTTSKKAFKKRKRSAAEKFGDEFWNKAKVREIVRGNGIIGHFEAKAMLANFRNVDVDQIDSTDVALRYIESKTVRRLKRSLKDMDYTIRKVLYYGSDFRHLHEQCMLGHTNDDDIFAVALNTQQNANVLNLGDLSNHISTSLDDYFQSPHTVVTPKDAPQSNMPQLNLFAAAADTAADMDMDVDVDVDTSNFDPLKGAQNVVMKSKVKFMNMKSPPMKGMAVEGQKMSCHSVTMDQRPIIGLDVAQLMQQAMDRLNVPLRVVGTLLLCAFEKSGCRAAVILGTGTNAAYIEPKRKNEIINVEWGAFDKSLPRQPAVDLVMDAYTVNAGEQYTEKMISGEYLGEMVRLLSLQVFGDKIQRYENETTLTQRWGLKSSIVSQILQRFDSQHMTEIYRILRIDLGLREFTMNDGKLFVQLCRVIVNRSADLAATLLLGVLEKTGLFTKIKDKELFVLESAYNAKKVWVGIDGSVWQNVPRYQQRMKNTMQKIVNKKIADKIKLTTSIDGSGRGAALATATHHEYLKQQLFAAKRNRKKIF